MRNLTLKYLSGSRKNLDLALCLISFIVKERHDNNAREKVGISKQTLTTQELQPEPLNPQMPQKNHS